MTQSRLEKLVRTTYQINYYPSDSSIRRTIDEILKVVRREQFSGKASMEELVGSYRAISDLFLQLENYGEAIAYKNFALSLNPAIQVKAILYNELSLIYSNLNDYVMTIESMILGIECAWQANNFNILQLLRENLRLYHENLRRPEMPVPIFIEISKDGMVMLTNDISEVGDVNCYLFGDYKIPGKTIWRVGHRNGEALMETTLNEDKSIITQPAGYGSLEERFGLEAGQFKYALGIEFTRTLPKDILKNVKNL